MADSEKRKAAKRRWIADVRAARKAAGLCVGCGGPVVLPEPSSVKRGPGRPRTGAYCDECLGTSGGETDRDRKLEELERRLDALAVKLQR